MKKAVSWTHPAESQMPVWRVSPVFKTPWMLMRAPDKRAIRKPNIDRISFPGEMKTFSRIRYCFSVSYVAAFYTLRKRTVLVKVKKVWYDNA